MCVDPDFKFSLPHNILSQNNLLSESSGNPAAWFMIQTELNEDAVTYVGCAKDGLMQQWLMNQIGEMFEGNFAVT